MNQTPPERLDTTDTVLEFGKHQGVRIQRVPVSYLKFMVRHETMQWRFAEAEMARRGTVTPRIEISGHAIDSASLRIRRTWHEHRDQNEGLHAWLCREAWEAWGMRQSQRDNDAIHLGVRWVFEPDGAWPILKTVMPARRRSGPAASEGEK